MPPPVSGLPAPWSIVTLTFVTGPVTVCMTSCPLTGTRLAEFTLGSAVMSARLVRVADPLIVTASAPGPVWLASCSLTWTYRTPVPVRSLIV